MQDTYLQAELAENKKKIQRLVDSMGILEGRDAKAALAERIEDLLQKNRDIENRIREYQGAAEDGKLYAEQMDSLSERLTDFSYVVENMSVEEKRDAVRAVVQKVIWDGENAHVVFLGAGDAWISKPHRGEDRK